MTAPSAYLPQRFDHSIDLDLSKNEGRPGSTELLAAVEDPAELLRRYPDTSRLRARLAALHGVSAESVLVTAGGDDALMRCFMARTGRGRRVLTTRPTFEMIPRYAEQSGATMVEIPWRSGPFPTDAVLDAITDPTDVVFVVSPNNPTGAVANESDLRKVASEIALVVLDAAYSHFADDDLTDAALEMDNVVVIRTLSKAYGLAGLRVGYLVGPTDLVAELGSYGSPYPVSSLSAASALARLDRPPSDLDRFVGEVKRERTEVTRILRDLGCEPLPSQANFVLAECADAEWLVSGSAALGVGLRRFPERAGLDNAVRITLPGDQRDFERLVHTLGTVLAPEALIFDLDGVLADVSRSQTIAIIETARSYDIEVTPEDVQRVKAEGSASDDWALTKKLCSLAGVEAPLKDVTQRFEALYQGSDDSPGLKRHERPLVDPATWRRWAGARPLAVVTGRPRKDAEEFLARFDLLEPVSALVAREDGPLKPDPAPVRRALAHLRVNRAWMLGDTPDDVAAARAAGVMPLGVVAPGDDVTRSRATLVGAARILERTLDLEGLLP